MPKEFNGWKRNNSRAQFKRLQFNFIFFDFENVGRKIILLLILLALNCW
jgi:hypothetical protein